MTEYIIEYIIESDWLRYDRFFYVIGCQSDPYGYHLNQRTAMVFVTYGFEQNRHEISMIIDAL